jgi:hypothetical protein
MRANILAALGFLILAVEPAAAGIGSFSPQPASVDGGVWVAKRKRRRKKKKNDPPPKPEQPPPSEVKGPADLPDPPPLPKGNTQVVAVLPLQALDVTDEITRSLELALYAEVEETAGLSAVSPNDVLNDLSNYGFDPSVCEGNVPCLAKAGRYARCHLALETRVAAIGGTLSISMRLVDTQTGAEVGRVADPVSEDPKERSQELHRLAVQLLAPDTYIGSLNIKAAQDGAEIYLDDRLIGTTPLAKPIAGLTAGPHILRVSKPGFSDVNQFVDVVYKRNSTITVDLENATISGLIVEQVSKTGFGALFLVANEAGIEVRIDTEPKGVTPVEPIQKVEAGKRRLSLRKEGFPPLAQEVEVLVDQRTELAVTLTDDGLAISATRISALDAGLPSYEDLVGVTQPVGPVAGGSEVWAPGWKFWTGIGLGGAAVASFAVASGAGIKVQNLEERATELNRDFDGTADENDEVCTELRANRTCKAGALRDVDDDGKMWSNIHIATLAAGGGLAALGLGFILWDIMAEPEVTAETSTQVMGLDVVPLPGGGQVVLTGQF